MDNLFYIRVTVGLASWLPTQGPADWLSGWLVGVLAGWQDYVRVKSCLFSISANHMVCLHCSWLTLWLFGCLVGLRPDSLASYKAYRLSIWNGDRMAC